MHAGSARADSQPHPRAPDQRGRVDDHLRRGVGAQDALKAAVHRDLLQAGALGHAQVQVAPQRLWPGRHFQHLRRKKMQAGGRTL